MRRLRQLRLGGSAGNEHLTAVVATVLLVLLAIEGAPLIVASTLLLSASGVLLISLDEPGLGILALHKASFIVWFGATSVHVLAHVLKLPRVLRLRVPGAASRVAVAGSAPVAGVLLAVSTVPAADRLEDSATGYVGIDAR
jgi:hypothetical protein